MSYELRPLTLAEILDAGFRLVQTEWRTLIGLAAVMQIPLVLVGLLVPWLFDPLAQPFDPGEELAPELISQILIGLGGIGVVYTLLYPFVAAAVTASVGHFYLGRPFGFSEATRAGLRSLLRLIGAYLALMLGYVVAGFVFGGLGFLAFAVVGTAMAELLGQAGTIGTVITVLLGIAFTGFVLFWILFAASVTSLLPAITVLESRGIFAVVRRAISLGSTARWRLIGVVITAGIVVAFPVFGAQLLIGMVPVVGLLVWALFQAIGFAFTTAVMVVLYFDLRCRAEHYDLELLAEQVEAGSGLGHG